MKNPPTKDIPSVGKTIKKLLKEKEITLKLVANTIGMTPTILSKIINDNRRLDDDNAHKLEEALELDPNYLVKIEKRYRDHIVKKQYVKKYYQEEVDDTEENDYVEGMERTKPKFKSEREIELEYRNFHRSMRDYIQHLLTGNLSYILISLSDTYALIAKVVNLNIRHYTETMFQSVDREIKKDFCILTIFEWGKGMPHDSPLSNLECAIKKLYTTEEIEKRLGEIGSV